MPPTTTPAPVFAYGCTPYEPAVHALQTNDAEAAATVLYEPMPHVAQAAVPVVSELYMPAPHCVQTDAPVVNALYVPAEQAVHTADVVAEPRLL